MLKYLKLSVVQKGKLDLWQESVEQPAAAMVSQTGLIETQISVKHKHKHIHKHRARTLVFWQVEERRTLYNATRETGYLPTTYLIRVDILLTDSRTEYYTLYLSLVSVSFFIFFCLARFI